MNPLLDPDARLVVAHRGNRVLVAENTVEAMSSAVALGVDAVEFDVRMSADGVPVVIHDARVDRTTDATGPVRGLTAAALQELNAAARFPAQPRARIPLLEELLAQLPDLPLVIEVKELEAVEATEAMIRRFGATERVVVGSSREAVMQRLYRTGLACCASTMDAIRLIPAAVLPRPARGRYQVLSITPTYYGVPIPVRSMAQTARRARIPTHVWTVNDPATAVSYWEAGVSAILTDDPAAILRARSR